MFLKSCLYESFMVEQNKVIDLRNYGGRKIVIKTPLDLEVNCVLSERPSRTPKTI